jgi:hypothetical protein
MYFYHPFHETQHHNRPIFFSRPKCFRDYHSFHSLSADLALRRGLHIRAAFSPLNLSFSQRNRFSITVTDSDTGLKPIFKFHAAPNFILTAGDGNFGVATQFSRTLLDRYHVSVSNTGVELQVSAPLHRHVMTWGLSLGKDCLLDASFRHNNRVLGCLIRHHEEAARSAYYFFVEWDRPVWSHAVMVTMRQFAFGGQSFSYTGAVRAAGLRVRFSVLVGAHQSMTWSMAHSYLLRIASAHVDALKFHFFASATLSNRGQVVYDVHSGLIGRFWSGTELFGGLTDSGGMIAVKQYLKGFWSKRFIRFALIKRGDDIGVRWEMGLNE